MTCKDVLLLVSLLYIFCELERSLGQRVAHQSQDVRDTFSRKGSMSRDIDDYPAIIQEANTVSVLVVPRLEEGTSDYLEPLVARTENRNIHFRPVKPIISEKLNKYIGGSPGREKRQDEEEPLLPKTATVCETRYDWVLLNRTWDTEGQEVEIYHGKYAQYVHVYYCANKGGSCNGISDEFTSECLEKEAFAKLLVKKEPGADGLNYQLTAVQIPHHCFCQLMKKTDA
ncbi:uncharacterized protein LOC100906862 [Galendromus occidentalis]|uniref:Uncharacterized protein LOC100906862 n=1 Tax=Galendromus occidentalis TaxID=34638 RepID=A0AAJ7SI70_9ACAR|nr:uncharacterized protein LOC100906862 [Galendromus occidentalis]